MFVIMPELVLYLTEKKYDRISKFEIMYAIVAALFWDVLYKFTRLSNATPVTFSVVSALGGLVVQSTCLKITGEVTT